MKKVIIIEDEIIAAQNLKGMLADAAPGAEVLAVLRSIEESVEWFRQNSTPDLVFMDIHLADGSAFHIFDQVSIDCPIIFTTAYDQYALQAFQVNSIDYLLKPIDKARLRQAIEKLQLLRPETSDNAEERKQLETLLEMLRQEHRAYKSCFLVPVKDKLIPLPVQEIACFYVEDKVTRVLAADGRAFIYDKPLELLMEQLSPQLFFRANRQYIVARHAIADIAVWFGGKIRLTLVVPKAEKIVISKARVPEFKSWYTE